MIQYHKNTKVSLCGSPDKLLICFELLITYNKFSCFTCCICQMCGRCSFYPMESFYKILFPKHLIAQQLQVCLFVIINGNEYHAFIGEQFLGNA